MANALTKNFTERELCFMSPKLHLRYTYTYYSFDEILDFDCIEEKVELGEEKRFTLHLQEDSSFIISEPKFDSIGKYVILTYKSEAKRS